jgi:hypothetical protein
MEGIIVTLSLHLSTADRDREPAGEFNVILQ